MISKSLIALILALGLAPMALARAADPEPAAQLAGTDFGRVVLDFVEAINSGESALQRAFLAARLSKTALDQFPLEEHLALVDTIYAQSGGFEIVEVVHPKAPVVDFYVRARRGGHSGFVYVFADVDEPGKIAEFGLLGKAKPGTLPEEIWPEARLEEPEIVKAIEERVERAAAEDRFSGVVLVAKGDRVLVGKAVGYAERAFLVPNRIDTKFHLGSINKMFTAVAIAQLVEAGKLSFDDTLAEVLPEYPNREAAAKITIRHLLTHSAGLGMLFERPSFDKRERYPDQLSIVRTFAAEPLLFEPGTRVSYSNEGFVVLGAVLEKVTGRNYFDYVGERVFAPAGMVDTGSFTLDEVTPNRAVGYGRFADDPWGIKPRRPNWMFLGWRGNASGGGFSTAPDLLKFATALKAHKLLGPEMLEQVTSTKGPMRRYGLGFAVSEANGRKVVGHGGGGPSSGINAEMATFLDGSYTVVVLANYDAPVATDFARHIISFLARQ